MDHIREILAANLVGTLATINEDGAPWATPVHVYADDEAVYWFSKDEHQHTQNVHRDPRVSLALWARTDATKGAYIQGSAEKLEGERAKDAFQLAAKPDGTLPSVFENTSPFCLKIGPSDTSRTTENRWYFYS